MAKIKIGRGGLDLPEGAYPATWLDFEECEPTVNSRSGRTWFKWTFVIANGTADGQALTATSSNATGPKSKAYGWFRALLGRTLHPEEELDTERLCPRDCQLILKRNPESGFLDVVDVLPARGDSPKPSLATPDPDDDLPF